MRFGNYFILSSLTTDNIWTVWLGYTSRASVLKILSFITYMYDINYMLNHDDKLSRLSHVCSSVRLSMQTSPSKLLELEYSMMLNFILRTMLKIQPNRWRRFKMAPESCLLWKWTLFFTKINTFVYLKSARHYLQIRYCLNFKSLELKIAHIFGAWHRIS